MVDHLTKQQRSICMSKVHSKNTTPEMIVRKSVHPMGYRYRLHKKVLPGKPDLVFPRMKKVMLVHGCLWHGHSCKHLPKSNVVFWENKIKTNKERDKKTRRELKKLGWHVLVVWECWTKDTNNLERKLSAFLSKKS